jgi:predicted nucleic acid-binding protein
MHQLEKIDARALSLGLVLVTHNSREFRRIPGLQTADWIV